ncbi:MAG: tetratricopeptide repeat protein [Candidatus Sericytochromatia bacterium]|nr:tetratricopeptide repeat protein [Candidatus Sericytochromatia bacterium]
MLIPLIKSKFRLPKLPIGYLRRENLSKKLENGLNENKKVTLVVGNAGYGKSSIVSDYIQSSNIPYLWYSLNESDTDLVVFMNHLIKGLKISLPSLSDNTLELIVSAINPIDSLHNIIGLLIEDLSIQVSEKFIIVIDDYQYLRDSEPISKAVEYLIEYLPENIQLILISRYMPNIKKLPQLRLRQQVEEINTSNLKLSKEELEQILSQQLNEKINDDDLNKIYEHTEGWIGIVVLLTQVYLSNSMLKEHIANLTDKNQPIFDYLASEIFELQDDKIKDFLLITSLLPKINNILCLEVGLENIQDNLEYLKKINLLEKDNEEFKYNPIFRDFLRERAKETKLFFEVQDLYNKVALYYQKKEQLENALEYFFLSIDYEKAEEILIKIAQDLIYSNRLDTLNKFLLKFPDEFIESAPKLQIYFGEIKRLWGNYTQALEHYHKAEHDAKCQKDDSTLALSYVYQSIIKASKGEVGDKDLIDEALKIFDQNDQHGLAFAYNTKGITYLFSERIAESLKYFEISLKYYENVNDSIGQAKVLHNLGFAYSMLGSFEHSRDTYERSIKQAESVGKYPYIMTYNNIAIIYNYSGDFNEAHKFAEKALNISQKLQYKRDMSYAYWTLGMISTNIGDPSKSEDYFNICLSIGLELGDRQVQAYALSGLSELARLQGKLNKAQDLIEEAIRRRDLPLDNQGVIELLMQKSAIFLDLGKSQIVKHDLEVYLLPKVEKLQYKYYLNHIYLYLAIIYENTDKNLSEKYSNQTYNLIKENNYYFFLTQQKYLPKFLKKKLEVKSVEVNITKPSQIRFQCFGEFTTYIDGQIISNKDWTGFKTKLTLAYLLHNPKGVTKEQLANLLYPDMDITRTAINVILSRLRKAIEPDLNKNSVSKYIIFNEGKYLFNFGTSYSLDTEEFNYLLKELSEIDTEDKKLVVLRKIVDLYKGDFLNDFNSEYWSQIERQVYRRKVESAFEQIFNIYYKKAEYHEIITLSEKEISIDICNEKAFQRKIKALIALDRKDDGLKHYKIMKNMLKSELGVEPNNESYMLYQKLV